MPSSSLRYLRRARPTPGPGARKYHVPVRLYGSGPHPRRLHTTWRTVGVHLGAPTRRLRTSASAISSTMCRTSPNRRTARAPRLRWLVVSSRRSVPAAIRNLLGSRRRVPRGPGAEAQTGFLCDDHAGPCLGGHLGRAPSSCIGAVRHVARRPLHRQALADAQARRDPLRFAARTLRLPARLLVWYLAARSARPPTYVQPSLVQHGRGDGPVYAPESFAESPGRLAHQSSSPSIMAGCCGCG